MDASSTLADALLAAGTVAVFFYVAFRCLHRVVVWARRQSKRAYIVGAALAPFMALGHVRDPDFRIVREAKQLKNREDDEPGDPPEPEEEGSTELTALLPAKNSAGQGENVMGLAQPLALDAYERLAEAYAALIDTKPHNAYYERPATLSLLPDVAGLQVLDAGCGPGVYAEWLVAHGARVVAFDVSPKMVALARARVGERARVHEAGLESELGFLESDAFDLVLAPLVLDYIRDWEAAFRRFRRALKPGGLLVFSVGHPFFEATYFDTDKYFETEQVSCTWRGFGFALQMPSYRRSLGAVINSVLESGFELLQILEPQPTEEFQRADPVGYERLTREPSFLCIKARRAV